MNDRTREVFRRVVEGYLTSGEPVGSRTLTRTPVRKGLGRDGAERDAGSGISGPSGQPACLGGRVPTQLGLRMFVDSLLEVGTVAPEDQERSTPPWGPERPRRDNPSG
jgi:heat-inducible transcriptional repressor